jgi:2-polyprenyl-3-methyl-5-hydroxy-6-metoxy-1,4-benzoquinol methylase
VKDETFRQSQYSVRECSFCGLLYRDCTLPLSDLDRYYEKVDFRKWETTGYWPTEACVLSKLRTLPRGSRILDFGCSSGRLLASLCRDYECFGFEINVPAAHEAAKKGLRMLSSDEIHCEALAKFDAVVLVDWFEHSTEPLELLRKLSRLVAHDGFLIISTGDGDADACRQDPAQFWYFRNLEHLCMLTGRHTKFLESALDLQLESRTNACHYNLSIPEKLVQKIQHFTYWQFRRGTFLARNFLRFVPRFRRAMNWPSPQDYTCSRDHVIAVFRHNRVVAISYITSSDVLDCLSLAVFAA